MDTITLKVKTTKPTQEIELRFSETRSSKPVSYTHLLPDQKHNTAVEYFNLLFETKRIKFSDTRKMGYEIISAF